MAKQINYPNLESLKLTEAILQEVEISISDETRDSTMVCGDMGIFLKKISNMRKMNAAATAASAVAGGAASVGLLSSLGITGLSAVGVTSGLAAAGSIVGGGMAAGLGVIAAPAVALVGGARILQQSKSRKNLNIYKTQLLERLKLAKERIAFENEKNCEMSTQHKEHLTALASMVNMAILDIENDIKQ